MELASPGYESDTCLKLTVPAPDWDTPIVEFPRPIRVTDRTMVRFRLRVGPGTMEGINVRNATEEAEYLLTFPLPGGGWTLVQRYLKSALFKRFGNPDTPRDGVVGDEISSMQIAYAGTELCLDDFEIFEAEGKLPELPSDALLPEGSYRRRRYECLETVFPFGVISTVAAGNVANAEIFGQTADERFEDDLLDLKRHGMNAISNFCDDGRVAWRLKLMEKYRLYLVETALANADLRDAEPEDHRLRLIRENRDHPWLLAWYGRDEPNDCIAYLENKQIVQAADPNHPVASAFNLMQVAKLLGPYMELMMLDPYSIFRPERSVDALLFHADLVRNAREYSNGGKVWMIPQAFSWRRGTRCTMRMPDPSEALFDVFNAIGAGAGGFLFFIYNDTCTYLDNMLRGEEFDDTLVDPWGNAHPTYEALSALARDLVPAMPALLDATEPGDMKPEVEYDTDRLTLGRLRNGMGDYVVLSNKDLLQPYRGTVRIALPECQKLHNMLTLREVPVGGDGEFALDLPPGGGAILMAAPEDSCRSVRRDILARRFDREVEGLSVECGVLKAQGLDVGEIESMLAGMAKRSRDRAALRTVREMLDAVRREAPGCWEMGLGLDRAQRGFGEIHRLIRPVVAKVDCTQDPEWVAALGRLKALSVTYFGLRHAFKRGDFSGRADLNRLLGEQQALRADVAGLVARERSR